MLTNRYQHKIRIQAFAVSKRGFHQLRKEREGVRVVAAKGISFQVQN